MGLLYYENLFSQLRVNRVDGQASPHKVAMLLAVINRFEKTSDNQNKIYFNEELRQEFTTQFKQLAGPTDSDNPHLPFFHLRSSGFWHHHIKPGKKSPYENLSTASGPGVIVEHIQYAYLDDELYELLGNEVVRNILRASLYKNLENKDRDNYLDAVRGWNWLECELVVDLYFKMLELQVANKKFNKTKFYNELVPLLNNRNLKAVESKCQNVSAIMVQYGYPYVVGLKPRWNYQKQLEKVVLSQLIGQSIKIDDFLKRNLDISGNLERQIEWDNVFDSEVPELIPGVKEVRPDYLARKIDYSQRENRNRLLGEHGEEFVINFERFRLTQAGREDLVNDVEWSSKKHGDGLGYDIRSFDPVKDEEIFIEVKTTNSGKYQPFYLSKNELSFSKNNADKFSLYRVFQFKSDPRIFSMRGEVDKYVNLDAETYRAYFS